MLDFLTELPVYRFRLLMPVLTAYLEAHEARNESEKQYCLELMGEALSREPIVDSSDDALDELTRKADDVDTNLQRHREHVADNVRSLRKERGWSQITLSAKSGIPQGSISKIENGIYAATYKTIEKLANAFGVPMDRIDLTYGQRDD